MWNSKRDTDVKNILLARMESGFSGAAQEAP